ncbi:hypothetical protein SAMN05444339_1109 [Loktanella atrilutea]|uniref:Uncharacterized protein n=1 Tax=Loktanella atrilutea TaxID=366533 RepID=A0A1M5DJ04_LOKAT|nr:hypothetical protein [Loktanella atrilutea]SHF66864.1 hypothetical protein SAMN05444339_1109 [Loktanella atrilutea]
MVMILPVRPSPDLMARLGYSAETVMTVLRDDLERLIALTPANEVEQLVRNAVVDCDGRLGEPDTSDWGPFDWTLTMYGISTAGDTLAEAIAQWCACARRTAQATKDAA